MGALFPKTPFSKNDGWWTTLGAHYPVQAQGAERAGDHPALCFVPQAAVLGAEFVYLTVTVFVVEP